MRLGVHVSGCSPLFTAFDKAQALGCNTMQVFSRSPQQWRKQELSEEDREEFRRRLSSAGVSPVFIHIPYLINLASPEAGLFKASIDAYIEDIKEACALKADYIVTHMGSHKKTSEGEGLERLTRALETIIKATSDCDVGILLENTSGSGSWLGYTFRHHRTVLEGVSDNSRLGLCLDTAHAYAAGYDIATSPGLDALLDEIDALAGLNRLKLIHLNDTKEKLGSHNDRHEHIGKGRIGREGMRRIVNHPRLRNVPFILETPKDTPQADPRNLKVVLRLRKR